MNHSPFGAWPYRATLCALVAALAVASPSLAQERLVVLNRGSGEAALVDPETHDVVARLPTGAHPHEVAISPDGRFAYVTGYGSSGSASYGGGGSDGYAGVEPRSTVTVLDLEGRSVRATFYPGEYRRLHGIRMAEGGNRLWLTSEADSGVVEMDARSGDVLMLWKTGGAGSHTLAVSPGGRKLFVANSRSDSVTVIDRLTVIARRIPAGDGPEAIDVSPDGREVWVGNRGDHTLTVIDARRERSLATLPSGGIDPARLRFSPDGREVWVSNRRSRELAVFDPLTRLQIGRVELDVEPFSLAFSADGRRVFVSSPESDRIVVVDVLERSVLGSFDPGEAPDGLAWSRIPIPSASGR